MASIWDLLLGGSGLLAQSQHSLSLLTAGVLSIDRWAVLAGLCWPHGHMLVALVVRTPFPHELPAVLALPLVPETNNILLCCLQRD